MKDHFIIVGAQRSGTTYLYNLLDEHPEILMAKPIKPEPKYFLKKKLRDLNLSDYHKLFFKNYSNNIKILGEKSTSYYEVKNSASDIYSILPKAKIIFILRNPIDRALSNYQFSLNNNLEKRSLSEVFIDKKKIIAKHDNISVDPFNYIGRGEYVNYIGNYLKYFPHDQIKVLIFEEFIDEISQIQDLYQFLEVDPKIIPTGLGDKINSSKGGEEIQFDIIQRLNSDFKKSIFDLEKLLNIDLSIWLNKYN